MTGRPARSTAEWASLIGAVATLAVVLALIVAQIPGDDAPPAPVATVARVRQVDDAFHVDVVVRNRGDRTAENVQVTAELTIGPDVSSGDQTVDFLAGGEEVDLSFVFDEDPETGTLETSVTGYAVP